MAVKVTLPDGTVKEYADGTNALQVAESISKGLAKVVVAAKVNSLVFSGYCLHDRFRFLILLQFYSSL